jgi:hypothetical protein
MEITVGPPRWMPKDIASADLEIDPLKLNASGSDQ